MYTVALTGGIGSGKSLVADFFHHLNIDIFDADIEARELVAKGMPCLNKIEAHFGKHILQKDGNLNRTKLRKIIIFDQNERTWLNQLMHPLIKQRLKINIQLAKSPYALLVHPLLTDKSDYSYVNRILLVDCSYKTQLARTMQRDNIPINEAQAMIDAQPSRNDRLKIADDILINENDIKSLKQEVLQLNKIYLNYAKSQT